MVTQIYTPPLSAYMPKKSKPKAEDDSKQNKSEETAGQASPQTAMNHQGGGARFDRGSAGGSRMSPPPASAGSSTRLASADLATVKDVQAKRPINITSIVTDLMGTAVSVGASEELIQHTVVPYMQSIGVESRKDKPSAKFIKMALEQASKALDEYISDALRQKSTVVSEWMEALLMQDVEYKADQPIVLGASVESIDPAQALAQAIESTATRQPPLSPEGKAQVKSLMQSAALAAKAQRFDEAVDLYNQSEALLEGKSHRQLEAQIQYYRGLAFRKQGDLHSAELNLAASLSTLASGGPDTFKARVHGALAQVYEGLGHTALALDHYKEKLLLDTKQGDEHGQIKTLTHVGELLLNQREHLQAKQALNQALTLSQAYHYRKHLGAIYNHLATLTQEEGDYKAAHGLYKQALRHTQRPEAQQVIYQNLAALFLKVDNAPKAFNALQKALSLKSAAV